MNLPDITHYIPKIELPFEIPVLLHPPVDHFAIALPVVVLLIEMINLVAKRRSLSMLSFFLILLSIVALVFAYFTGSTDAKEAVDFLTQEGVEELKEHKILGTYLMFASVVVLIFKIFSIILSKGVAKGFYLLILILFVIGIFNQGKEGGELVYEFGANVEKVKELDDELFDTKEALEELEEASKSTMKQAVESQVDEEVSSKEVNSSINESNTELQETPAEETSTVKEAPEVLSEESISLEEQVPVKIPTH